MRRKEWSRVVLLSIAVTFCLGAFLFDAQFKVIRRAMDDLIYDNRNHFLSCEMLPAESTVKQIVGEQQAIIWQIEQVNPGQVGVEIDTSCPGKADLVIWYASHQNRLAIEKIINSETFYGVPYRLQNR